MRTFHHKVELDKQKWVSVCTASNFFSWTLILSSTLFFAGFYSVHDPANFATIIRWALLSSYKQLQTRLNQNLTKPNQNILNQTKSEQKWLNQKNFVKPNLTEFNQTKLNIIKPNEKPNQIKFWDTLKDLRCPKVLCNSCMTRTCFKIWEKFCLTTL